MSAEQKMVEARKAYYAVQWPTRPQKPALERNPTSAQAIAYAKALEEYEQLNKDYKELEHKANCLQADIINQWAEHMKKAYMPDASDALFATVYSQAWEDSPDNYLAGIEDRVLELSCFVEKVLDIVKKGE